MIQNNFGSNINTTTTSVSRSGSTGGRWAYGFDTSAACGVCRIPLADPAHCSPSATTGR